MAAALAQTSQMITPHVWDQLLRFAARPQTTVSLRQIAAFAQDPLEKRRLSTFLAGELPIRFAHRVKELDELPDMLREQPAVATAKSWYANAFETIQQFSPASQAAITEILAPTHRQYHENLELIRAAYDPTTAALSQRVLDWARSPDGRAAFGTTQWLDKSHRSRIGMRFLIDQYAAALNESPPTADDPHAGSVCNTNVHNIIKYAVQRTRDAFAGEGLALPEVELVCPADLQFEYVPNHLSFISFEVLKNSFSAVARRYKNMPKGDIPPVKVIVIAGKEDITIRITDNGGGMPRSALPRVWTYTHGKGLPLSRIHARYFGGDLRVSCLEGEGTNVYVHLNRLSDGGETLS